MKRLLVATAMIMVVTPALAQERLFNLRLPAKEVDAIGKALTLLPYGEAYATMQDLQSQINQQNAVFEKAAEEAKKGGDKSAPSTLNPKEPDKPCTADMKLLGKC